MWSHCKVQIIWGVSDPQEPKGCQKWGIVICSQLHDIIYPGYLKQLDWILPVWWLSLQFQPPYEPLIQWYMCEVVHNTVHCPSVQTLLIQNLLLCPWFFADCGLTVSSKHHTQHGNWLPSQLNYHRHTSSSLLSMQRAEGTCLMVGVLHAYCVSNWWCSMLVLQPISYSCWRLIIGIYYWDTTYHLWRLALSCHTYVSLLWSRWCCELDKQIPCKWLMLL